MKRLITTIPIIFCLTFSLTSCEKFKDKRTESQSFICSGVVLLNKENPLCRNKEIEFTLIINTSNISVEHESCTSRIEFNKLHKDIDNEMKIEFSYTFEHPITKHKINHSFGINKVTGEFGLGEYDINEIGMDSLSVGGFCKKVNNIVD
jgi:hypothetical protein